MIKQIDVEQFQSWRKASLELDPGVNTLVGDTGSGKSAILKAMDWAINNRPGGDTLEAARFNLGKKKGTTKTTITTDTDIVSRIKSNTNNEYTLNKDSFKAFGQGVPKEIKDALNIGPINFQRQEDKQAEGRHLFLLTASSGEVARYLNKIVDLDIIDKAHANIEKVKRRTATELSMQQATLKEQQVDLKENYADLESRERAIKSLEQIERKSTSLKQSLSHLTQLNSAIAKENQALVPLMKTLKAEAQVNRLIKTAESLSTDMRQLRDLDYLTKEIEFNKNICSSLSGTVKAKKQVDGLLDLVSDINRLQQQKTSLRNYNRLIADAEIVIEVNKQNIDTTTKQFKELMPEQCPLCGK